MPAGEKTKELWKKRVFRKKMIASHLGKSITHAMSGTRFYKTWLNIRRRCDKRYASNYKNYGGRGIECEWVTFESFRDDMFKSYQEHVKQFGELETTIERVDNNGNYCKKNCRWATRYEQATNRRVLSTNSSGYQGVFASGDKWRAQITVNNRKKHLGLFKTKAEAVRAYDAARSETIKQNKMTTTHPCLCDLCLKARAAQTTEMIEKLERIDETYFAFGPRSARKDLQDLIEELKASPSPSNH